MAYNVTYVHNHEETEMRELETTEIFSLFVKLCLK